MATFLGILVFAAIIAGLWFLFDDIGRDYDWSNSHKESPLNYPKFKGNGEIQVYDFITGKPRTFYDDE